MRVAIYDYDPALNDGQDWYPVVSVTTWEGVEPRYNWEDASKPTYRAVSIEPWTEGVVTTSMKYSENTGFFKISGNPPTYIHENYSPPPPSVPDVVSKLWLLRAIRAAGLEAQVLGLLSAPGNEIIKRDWDAAYQIKRHEYSLNVIGVILGLNSSQIDSLFITAGHES
jgi:hypothetical protein